MPWRVKVYPTKDKDDWLYVVDEITLEPMVFDDWPDAQLNAHLWTTAEIEEYNGLKQESDDDPWPTGGYGDNAP
jgi:hypothetical protein